MKIKMIQHAGLDTWDNVTLMFKEKNGNINLTRFKNRNDILGVYRALVLEEGKGHRNPMRLQILDKVHTLPYAMWSLMLEYFEDWFQEFMRQEECLGDANYFG